MPIDDDPLKVAAALRAARIHRFILVVAVLALAIACASLGIGIYVLVR